MALLTLVLTAAATITIVSGVNPGPAPDTPVDELKAGGECLISWQPDATGIWKKTYIELMAGENLHMQHITSKILSHP
jgi:hypothetical protein